VDAFHDEVIVQGKLVVDIVKDNDVIMSIFAVTDATVKPSQK
jgi:hypothetical protein